MTVEPRQSALILVVEDNPANQMLAEAVLQGHGSRVNLAGSAPRRWRALSSSVRISS
jgi:CheY-like chemotaxis protein